MGGQTQGCDAEYELMQRIGQEQGDQAFAKHWDTWITQEDVALIKQYNLNSVRASPSCVLRRSRATGPHPHWLLDH